MRRVSISLAVVAVAEDYQTYEGKTCWNGHGAVEIDTDDSAPIGLDEDSCKARCDEDEQCDCVAFQPSTGKCWKRKDCVPDEFGPDDNYNVFVKAPPAPSPPEPSPPAPGPSPSPSPAPDPSGYAEYWSKTCYNGHGGTEIDDDDSAPDDQTQDSCEARCNDDESCDCVTFRPSDGKCWKRKDCDPDNFGDDDNFNTFVKPYTPAPSPPSPSGPSDVNLQWETGHGHGACDGPAIQGDDVAQILDNNGIKISTNAAPAGGCVYRVASPSIDLDEHPHLEADIETSGNTEAYGKEAGQWFSFWMYPPGYAYANGDGESGEVDFVENIPNVRTNFAGCSHDCHETEWGQASNAVSGHVTMHYDKSAQRINVYRCDFGSDTCSTDGEVAYVDLPKMTVNKPYTYTLCTDVWYAQPGMDFSITVTNLRILSAESFGKYLNSSSPFII